MRRGIYKIFFFWPYRLCQWIARGLFYCGINLRLIALAILGAMLLAMGLAYKGLLPPLWEWGGVLYLLLQWFGLYLFLACLLLDLKSHELCKRLKRLSEKPPSDLMGISPVTGRYLYTKDLAGDEHWHVMGREESLRNLIQPFLEADARKGRSIIILAPEGEECLLEEITFILRERSKEEYRSFFYHSLSRPELSASYSPFFGSHGVHLLGLWTDLKDPDERRLFASLLRGLKELKKPFDLTDLLLLLRDKNAVYALCDFRDMQDYLKEFHAYPDARRSLAEKLEEFGKELELEGHPIHRGLPLDPPDLFRAHKHLYVEFGQKASELTTALFFDLFWEMEERFGKAWLDKPFVYLIHPEKLGEHYQIKEMAEKLVNVSHLRVFSRQYFPCKEDHRSSIVAPGALLTGEAREYQKSTCHLIERERKNLKKNTDFFSTLNDETFEAAERLARKMNLKLAYGFFHYYDRSQDHQWQYYLFFIPAKVRPKLNYEPFQRRYTPAGMLNLPELARGRKRKNHDPGVIDIIKGFKPPERQKGESPS